MITLRFVSHPGIFTWACKFAQYGFPYTHVELVMDDGRLLGAMGDGVKARPQGYDSGRFLQEKFLTIKMTADQETVFTFFLNQQIGKPYDRLAVTAFFVGRDWQEPDSWDCSELIASGLASCGVFPQHLAVSFSRITVRDVFLLTSTLTALASGGADG